MSEETKRQHDIRLERAKKTIALEKTDRVPFIPKIGSYMAENYGLSHWDFMKDARNLKPCAIKCCNDLEPDIAWIPVTYSADCADLLESQYIRYPGARWNLPLTANFQMMDGTYLEDDEFDEFLLDPTHFMMTKVMPRKYKKLAGFANFYGREIYDLSVLGEMGGYSQDVYDSFDYYLKACRLNQKRGAELKEVNAAIEDAGFPVRGAAALLHPFDAYADSLRGLLQATMDVLEFPDEVHEVCQRIEDMNMDRAIAKAKARGDNLVYIPLHAAGDDFMSPANYEEFYWPQLKRMIEKLVKAGLTPYVFCEGKYNTRLQYLKDVPKGKVVYMFEQVDIAEAKKQLDGIATICGNLSSTLLITGTPAQIEDETKKLLDIAAPGGGFIMDASIVIDTAKEENMMAWKETTFKYGVY